MILWISFIGLLGSDNSEYFYDIVIYKKYIFDLHPWFLLHSSTNPRTSQAIRAIVASFVKLFGILSSVPGGKKNASGRYRWKVKWTSCYHNDNIHSWYINKVTFGNPPQMGGWFPAEPMDRGLELLVPPIMTSGEEKMTGGWTSHQWPMI